MGALPRGRRVYLDLVSPGAQSKPRRQAKPTGDPQVTEATEKIDAVACGLGLLHEDVRALRSSIWVAPSLVAPGVPADPRCPLAIHMARLDEAPVFSAGVTEGVNP
jgi:hypothetical protein